MTVELGRRTCLLVVLGATGTGKSKLAIQLAKAFNGEVISADSMQVYKGLDIVTNKVTEEEASGVTHHCLGFLDPLHTFTVFDFRNRALPIIDRMFKEGKLPIVVGGTHYYIEALLWEVLMEQGEPIAKESSLSPVTVKGKLRLLLEEIEFTIVKDKDKLKKEEFEIFTKMLGVNENCLTEVEHLLEKLGEISDQEAEKILESGSVALELVKERYPKRFANRSLHARLRELDSLRAEQLHYNNVRKIARSLEIVEQTGITHSELLKKQQESVGGSILGGPLRFPNRTLVLWITANQEELDRRLDARVDDMVEKGLPHELIDFHNKYNQARLELEKGRDPFTQGIFQSIGLKEFHPYMEDRTKLHECIDGLKVATRRYARRQIKWIQGRFIKAPGRQVPPVYQLDGTDPKEWDKKVLEPATALVKEYLGLPLGDLPLPTPVPRQPADVPYKQNKQERLCKVCMRVFIGDHQWEVHLKSKKHKAMGKKRLKGQDKPSLNS